MRKMEIGPINLICFSLVWLLSIESSMVCADTIYVPDHYNTIQEAIDAAINGDHVVVRDGTHNGTIDGVAARIDSKYITVQSENGPDRCIIDGENMRDSAGFIIASQPLPERTTISGFTITRFDGRGISCVRSSPIIQNCIIKNNSSYLYDGTGIGVSRGSPLIMNCVVTDNNSGGLFGGAGICTKDSAPTVMNCLIIGNSAEVGGGVAWHDSHPMIINSIISNNSASEYGGGIFSGRFTFPGIINCLISGNKAKYGGGIYARASSPTITNSTLSMNWPDGIRLIGGSDAVITNSILCSTVKSSREHPKILTKR